MKEEKKQLVRLCRAHTVRSDPVIRPFLVYSDKFTSHLVTNEKQRKTEMIDASSKLIKVEL